jgi:cell division protein FtsB
VFVFAGYLLLEIFATQIEIVNKKKELADITAKNQEMSLENNEYQNLLNSCDTDEYIERIAREKLGYVCPDEKVYIDISGK